MSRHNDYSSHAFDAGRLNVRNIAPGRSTFSYDGTPPARIPFDLGRSEFNASGPTRHPQQRLASVANVQRINAPQLGIKMDCRRKAETPSERGMLRSFSSHISFIQRMLDGLLITGVYCATYMSHGGTINAQHMLAAVSAVLIFLIFAEMNGLYKSWRTSPQSDEIRVLITTWAMLAAALLLVAFATKTSEMFSRLVVITWLIAAPLSLIALRMIRRGVLSQIRRHGANTRSVAIVGNNSIGHRLIKPFDATPWAGLVVKGFFDARRSENPSVDVDGTSYSVGTLEDLHQQVRAGEIDSVYIAMPLSSERVIDEVVAKMADTTASVYVVPDSFASELMNARWVDFGGVPMLSVQETPFYGVHGWLKRLEDIVLGGLILMLISPLMLLISVAIKATSPGPVLFKQRRYGLNGAVVEVWKFRSMTVCEDGGKVTQATKGDKRVTPLGAFLRKTSLDELPQFFNVLQGSMSVIGPRPHAVTHNEQYRQLIKGYMVRHKVKPGISGWAQINGWRGETDTLDKMKKRVEFDMAYIQNWSLWLDLKIVFLTLFRGFVGKNVY